LWTGEEEAMTGDAARREPTDHPADIWRLPDVRSIEIRHVRYSEPIRRYVTSQDVAEYFDAIEFHVTTDGELPVRAIPAVLFVGDVMVNDYEQLARDLYVFRAFDPEELMAGTPISLGWQRRPDKTQMTDFRYEPPKA
jgi:hypothetical protein